MTKEKARNAIAYVLGFKPVKTMHHRLMVIISHVILWGIFLTLPLFIYRVEILDSNFVYRELINKSFLIALFYFNYYYLLPRFFQKRRLVNYFFSILGAIVFLCLQQLFVEIYFLRNFRKHVRSLYLAGKPVINEVPQGGVIHFANPVPAPEKGNRVLFIEGEGPVSMSAGVPVPPFTAARPTTLFGLPVPRMILQVIVMNALTSGLIILLISGVIKLANSLVISEKQKKMLENERLNAELNFLKLQINPHFLFNTLNSIYSQAHFKSEQTEYSVLKFSQIMRYVLYDSTTEKIALAKDLEYIDNYIHLQRIRLSKNISINYRVTGSTNRLLIAPLLLITFIENAFKHGISYSTPSKIAIDIKLEGNVLTLEVGNARHSTNKESPGGVGMLNARRRLDVLYPGRYLLDVIENGHLYIINLKIDLDYET